MNELAQDNNRSSYPKAFLAFESLIRWMNRGTEITVALLMLTIVAVILIQVFRRYVLNDAYQWPEELAGYLMVWVVFLGSGVALWRREHISLTFFVERYLRRYARAVRMSVYLFLLAFLLPLTASAWRIAALSLNVMSQTLPISLFWGRVAIFIGFVLMTVNLVYLLTKEIIGWRKGTISE